MGLDMKDFKVVYGNQAFNVINVMPVFGGAPLREGFCKPEELEVWYINENGELELIRDKASKFRFVRR